MKKTKTFGIIHSQMEQVGIFVLSRKLSRLIYILISLVLAPSFVQAQQLPDNAHSNKYSSGWSCNRAERVNDFETLKCI
jgi:hypothetical protein